MYVGRFEDVQSWLFFLLGLHWIKNNFYIAEGDGVRCLLCSVDSLWCCSDLVLWSKFRNLVFLKKPRFFLATQKKEGNGFLRYIYYVSWTNMNKYEQLCHYVQITSSSVLFRPEEESSMTSTCKLDLQKKARPRTMSNVWHLPHFTEARSTWGLRHPQKRGWS